MAKKQKPKDWTHEVENVCRNAVSKIEGFDKLPELEWTQHVAEGLECYLEGIKARLYELEDDEENEEKDS